ncbi:pimeloyl-ACP methyl ester esterase BioH [Luteimonas yindakuii]|uniref:Pimeloyl-[acyl-carrier protein] methyl ester esterase n=1 Tax=Luteimonas yindakuii TaxID=2565782 RepID=A0A4Z1REW8_9GAMM|nr:pimeloyl-ACP methyl ester esterase BioH [Luteimonas yindakuii]TKS55398.1 pimeloyl-ACP methyl ester esterase BioH [Luteimonas yindakuii]
MHMETSGTGPDLVLLHGWAMHGGVFAPLVDALRADFTMHVVDLPGHGHSCDTEVPLALAPVADALAARLPRALWLGWSLGGLFALEAARRHPRQFRGVVMLASSPRFVRDDDWPHGMSAEIFQGFAQGLRHDYRGTLDRFIALEAFGSDDARGDIRALRDEVFARGEPAAEVLADGLGLLERGDLRAVLPGLRMPSLWLAGRRDRLVSPRAMEAAAALAADAHVHVLANAGHAPFLTHPDAVADVVRTFAAGLDVQDPP